MFKKLRDMLTHRRIADERNRALRACFGRSLEELRALFYRPLDAVQLSVMEKSISKYPEIHSLLADPGLNAFYAHFQLEVDKVDELLDAITVGFDRIDENLYVRYSGEEVGNLSIVVAFKSEFSGSIASLMANDISVFDRIAGLKVCPPPPWIAFPEIGEPLKLGFLQGDIEYWWDNYWSPFWESLAVEEREAYLRSHDATEEWGRCIWLHGREARELLENALSEKDLG